MAELEITETPTEKTEKKPRRSLLRSTRGGTEFIEKVIMIGLFALVAAVGVSYIADKVTDKFTEQGDSIESDVHGSIPSP